MQSSFIIVDDEKLGSDNKLDIHFLIFYIFQCVEGLPTADCKFRRKSSCKMHLLIIGGSGGGVLDWLGHY